MGFHIHGAQVDSGQALLRPCSGSDQVRSPSAQVKAVAAHVRRLKQNRRG
jgi:hypothetical protein